MIIQGIEVSDGGLIIGDVVNRHRKNSSKRM